MVIALSRGGLSFPNIWTLDDAAPSDEPGCAIAEYEVFAALRDSLSTHMETDSKTPSWARAAASMCRKIDDTLHLTMVSGSIFSHYVEYLAPSTFDRGGAFLRETIARSRSRGTSVALHPDLEIYESIASGGKCVLFPLLSLMEEDDYYIEACQVAAERIRGRQKGGPLRVDREDKQMGVLKCADCLLSVGGFELRIVHDGPGPAVYGKYIVEAGDYFYACILGEDGSSIEAYPFIFFLDTETARKILRSVMKVDNIYKYSKGVGVRL